MRVMHQSSEKITVAIDGYSACGKSTLAKELARKLGYIYVDSGAMYRAVTHYLIKHNTNVEDHEAVTLQLPAIEISFRNANGRNVPFLNGDPVEAEIRSPAVNRVVSIVAAIPAVRRAMVRQQQQIGKSKGIVMDGRDIGTVVFPGAELKIFLTADLETRVRRRYREMVAGGIQTTEKEVRHNLEERDRIDTSREDSPLKKAEDAVIIDNSNLSREEQAAMAFELARLRIEAH